MGGNEFSKGVGGEGELKSHGLLEDDPHDPSRVRLTAAGLRYGARLRRKEVKKLKMLLTSSSWGYLINHIERSMLRDLWEQKETTDLPVELSGLDLIDYNNGPHWSSKVQMLREELLIEREKTNRSSGLIRFLWRWGR